MITENSLLEQGLMLPVMEEFYSLQGEGFHTGLAAYFIRIGGCDVCCSWCDVKESWNASIYPPIHTDGVVKRASSFAAKAVVVTGGEPLLYNLNYLCEELEVRGIKRFIETSGTESISGNWDWICVSPKRERVLLDPFYALANELKIVITDNTDFERATEMASRMNPDCHLFLQPEWTKREIIIPLIVDFIGRHPCWRISLQSHKFMKIP